jgi:hypothetical protein
MTTSNAIGSFAIGQSAVGWEKFDWSQTIMSQYANSPILLSLIESFADAVDPTQNLSNFYDYVWNLDTAQGYGLDLWGRIVGVNRVLQINPQKYFGFNEAGQISADPFGQSPFYSGEVLTGNYALTDDAFRQLIYAKAAANIWDGSIPGLNAILRLLFPGQVCYVTDGQNMTMTYVFDFVLTPVQLGIINNSGVLPRPAGVSAQAVQL